MSEKDTFGGKEGEAGEAKTEAFVPSSLETKATAAVDAQVEKDMQIPDPEAPADALAKAIAKEYDNVSRENNTDV